MLTPDDFPGRKLNRENFNHIETPAEDVFPTRILKTHRGV